MSNYTAKYIKMFMLAINRKQLSESKKEAFVAIINKIYNNGFTDGSNRMEESQKNGWGLK